MYKVIYNDLIIDVLKKPKYVRYLARSQRSIITDYSSAQGVLSSNNKEIYSLAEKEIPEGKTWKRVTLQKISEWEYTSLKKSLSLGERIIGNENILLITRSDKISELSADCNKKIINGIDILLSDGKYHYFGLTLEDQVNLMILENEILNGKKSILYHESGKELEYFSAEDIMTLITESKKHKNYHTVYFNMLRESINKMDDISEIKKIKYGDKIPNQYYLEKFNSLLES